MERSVTSLGGGLCVTGSCHLLRADGLNILVDCGLAQGRDEALAMEGWPVKPSDVDYLFLTHAHIDHIGRIPELMQKGFRGEIITTHPTKALLVPMLEDALSFSGMSDDKTDRLIHTIDELSWGFEFGETFDLKKGLRFKLGQAGHILGSCFIRFEAANPAWSVIFSGDLGARNTPLLPDPDAPAPCDLLILESTYGNRHHEDRTQRLHRLGEALSHSLSDGGKVFIPAFALGRAQELIYEMDRLFSNPDLQRSLPALRSPSQIPVCLDSPLGLKLTRITSSLKPYWDSEARGLLARGDNPLDFDHLYAVTSHQDHLRLLDMPGPAVIIAGSGMCTGGRIVDHLKAGLPDSRNDILFVGYQAEGTPGREIIRHCQDHRSTVDLDGERIPVRARIHTLSGYSAHADARELVDWVKSMQEKPQIIRLTHGSPSAQMALANRLIAAGYRVSA